jgi:hypothetical protein
MRKIVFLGVVLALSVVLPVSLGRAPSKSSPNNRSPRRPGFDPNLLATLFVTEGENQFILAFRLRQPEQTMQSQLKAELKQAIAPVCQQAARS